MSLMTRRTFLPALVALPLQLAAAVWWQQAGPTWADGPEEGAEAHQHADHDAPAVTLAAQSVCNSRTNRTVVLARFEAAGGAAGYQKQVAWGHAPNLSSDDRPWGPVVANTSTGNRPWPVRLNQEPEVGKAYSLRVRALDEDGNHGPWGEATYEYSEGTASAPVGVAVSDVDGDYSRAVLSWRDGSDGAGNGFWFKVQRRVSGGGADGWQESRWTKVEQRGSGEEKSYRHTVTGLDPAQAHDFRVAGQKRDCGATKWSDVVSLTPPAPPPVPDYTVTVDYGEGAVALMVTPTNAPSGVTGYTLRHRVKGSDADYVEVSADPDDAAAAPSEIFRGSLRRPVFSFQPFRAVQFSDVAETAFLRAGDGWRWVRRCNLADQRAQITDETVVQRSPRYPGDVSRVGHLAGDHPVVVLRPRLGDGVLVDLDLHGVPGLLPPGFHVDDQDVIAAFHDKIRFAD